MTQTDDHFMSLAMNLARQGQGHVEPNPMVGCVIVADDQVVGKGWHTAFGKAHAEVEALRDADHRAAGGIMYVTLEPCCHHGKTPPCTKAIIDAGIQRVVVAESDPFDEVSGRGIAELRSAGIQVDVGTLAGDAHLLNAPYLKRLSTSRPWIIVKWAMSLDGKIATRTGDSKWISSESSRALVHQLRGRVDAIMIGSGTAITDDPLLTARPAGARVATRIVVDSEVQLRPEHRLVQTARQYPLLVAVSQENSNSDSIRPLVDAGAEIYPCRGDGHDQRLDDLLLQLGQRQFSNVLVEGGGRLLGSLFDLGQIDEIHAFIAPKLVGGRAVVSPLAGRGLETIAEALRLKNMSIVQTDHDIYVSGYLAPPSR